MDIDFKNLFTKKRIFFASVLLAAFAGGLALYLRNQKISPTEYFEVYRLVPEKISQSAAIPIYLPKGVESAYAQSHIKLEPPLMGQWVSAGKNNKQFVFNFLATIKWPEEKEVIYFKPSEDLKLNRYYKVFLAMADGSTLAEDFLAVENPAIIAIFPNKDTEAPENSEITIVFNRPMVPLTTLGYLEEKDVPVGITPHTEGRFKWITTRNLQFIPKERLIRSSRYEITIKPGLISTDGLPLSAASSSFITRRLRYTGFTEGTIVYNQPLAIHFNQPVDLEKTKKEIILRDETTGKEVPFIAEYKKAGSEEGFPEEPQNENGPVGFFKKAKSFLSNPLKFKASLTILPDTKEKADKTVVYIYNEKDRFGREKFWDFDHRYYLEVRKAYPEEGSIILDEVRQISVMAAGIIKEIKAESARTFYSQPDFFDPQGTLLVRFYEEINLDKSKIEIPKNKSVVYGEKCAEDQGYYSEQDCRKTTDKKTLRISFKEEEIGIGEKFTIVFDKIVNAEGITVNNEPIRSGISVYPQFRVLRTFPEDKADNASVSEIVICSNTPLLVPDKKDYKTRIVSSIDYEINYWPASYRVEQRYPEQKCELGEFNTAIYYGLMPKTRYSLELYLEDVFGQKYSGLRQFSTGEMPSEYLAFYHLQQINDNVTSPAKTKLTYAAQNMEYVNLEICQLSARNFLSFSQKSPSPFDRLNAAAFCQKVVEDKIDLPRRYWGKNYFKVDIKDYFPDPVGHYILTFSNPNYQEEYWKRETNGKDKEKQQRPLYERTYLTVTNLAVAEKRITPQTYFWAGEAALSAEELKDLNNLYWVTDIATLAPVRDAKVTLYRNNTAREIEFDSSFTTNSEGIAFTKIIGNLAGVIITKGNDSTIISGWQNSLNRADQAASARRVYLYTDKPIYRPGEEVFIKGLYRLGYDGNYEIFIDKPVTLKIRNPRYEEIFSRDLPVSDFGTFNTSFLLDKNAPLGTYEVCSSPYYNCAYFDLLEYEPAAFEVKVKSDKEEYISKDTANLDVEATYYFGVPVEDGEVYYTVSTQNYYFDRYADNYFRFTPFEDYYWLSSHYGEKFILRGKTSLSNGKARISQLLDLEQLFPKEEERKSKIVVFDITITNPQGRSVSSQKSFLLHAGEFYLGLTTDKWFVGKEEPFDLKVKSVNTKGEKLSVKNIDLNLYRVRWDYLKRQEASGGFFYKWEKKRDFIEHYSFDTTTEGDYLQKLKISKEGEYEAEALARDSRGNLVRSIDNIYVYGEGEVSVRPTQNTELEIVPEKTKLNVGDEGTIIIKSPYKTAKALISIERGKVFEYAVKEIEGNFYKFSFPVKEEYLPNVFVSVLLQSAAPEIKFGQTEFDINTSTKELDIAVKSNKTHYLPGEEVILDISVKDWQGKAVPTELSVAVVDLSVLALKGNPKKDPLVFFYNGFPLTVSTASNLKNILKETEIFTKGGSGAMEASKLARKARGVFRETAFWQAVVRTDVQGQAQLKFILPDNLTTWQTETIGLTKDTKLGVAYQEFMSRKDLMVVPLKPRFAVPGDTFLVGAKVFNQTNESQNLTVSFASPTLILKEKATNKEIKLEAGKTDTVYFGLEAPFAAEVGSHSFTLSAKNEVLEDTVTQSISITPNNTYETTATANYTSDVVAKEYVFLPSGVIKEKGSLTINSSATLAMFLSDGLNYLLEYPYGCTEQISSRLNALAIVKRGLNVPNLADKFKLKKIKDSSGKEYTLEEIVEIGLAKLYNNQQYSGGFSFWENTPSSFYATLSAVETLHNLSLAGFQINQEALKKGAAYLYQQITTDSLLYSDRNNVILATYVLSGVPAFAGKPELEQKIREIVADDLFINEKISNAGLAYLAILMKSKEEESLRQKVFGILENRIDNDSRGAFLEPNQNFLWYYYETTVKDTALYLKALAISQRENPLVDKLIRWLLNSRERDGAWGSTNNTLAVVDAFTDFLSWKRETESDFALKIQLNEKTLEEFHFEPSTILEQRRQETPLKELALDKNNLVKFSKTNNNKLENSFYYDLALKYYLPAEKIPPRDEGFSINRAFYGLEDKENKKPRKEAVPGEVLRVHLEITVPKSRRFVIVEDYIPAGMEIVNLDLATEQKSLRLQEKELTGRELFLQHKELYDDRAFLFTENIGPGVYEFDYFVRALTKGKFTHLPAVVYEMYFPETFGRTASGYFTVK